METNRSVLNTLNSILRRDATDTTYKYALLRALAEIADEAEQHVSDINEKEVVLPLGLVVEKWLYYYYPLIENNLPQRSGVDPTNPNQQQIAFLHQFRPLIDFYTDKGKFPAFVSDYQGGRLKGDNKIFLELLKKLRHTITRYPMKHLGYSVYGDYYKIVNFDRHRFTFAAPNAQSPVDSLFLIQNFGKFKIRREYYDVFRAVGGFVTGADAIVNQWANFTSNAVQDDVPIEPRGGDPAPRGEGNAIDESDGNLGLDQR